MENTTYKKIFEKIVEIFNTGDITEVDTLFAPNYIDHQADQDRPSDKLLDGPEEFKQVVLGARKAMPNLKVTIDNISYYGDKITAHLNWLSTNSEGKTKHRRMIDTLRIENDLIVEHWGKPVVEE